MPSNDLLRTLADLPLRHPFLIGLLLRLFLATALPLLLDSGSVLDVKYTDVDYYVFSDAAQLVREGKSPYDRHTYRYTPFLAYLLSLGGEHGWFGRFVFCLADALCGLMVVNMRMEQRRRQGDNEQPTLPDLLWWLLNPLPINICTRGSAESLIVLLPVLMSVQIATYTDTSLPLAAQAVLCGVVHGVGIHFKLYPVIYTLSYMCYFSRQTHQASSWKSPPKSFSLLWNHPKHLCIFISTWIKRVLLPAPILFFLTSAITFSGMTLAAVDLYGNAALSEGLLYHFSRLDHRHNYSIYWYSIYLCLAKSNDIITNIASKVLFLPQILLLLFLSLGLAPYDLATALFLQTHIFVCQNKVITGQYFTWYLCLLPLCTHQIRWMNIRLPLLLLGLSIILWLTCAYCLEMLGMPVHLWLWIASIIFFVANVHLTCSILKNYHGAYPMTGKSNKNE